MVESVGREGNMCGPWNTWDCQPPPMCTVKTLLKHSEIKEMKNTVLAARKTMKKLNFLHKEAALLSRYLYKFKRLFRQDKGLQHLVKVNQALHRYLKLKLDETLSLFLEYIPTKLPKDNTYAYLPTRQMLKWVLLRIQAFAGLFVRIMEEAKNAGKFLYARLCLGWSDTYMTFALALTSRIFALAKFALINAKQWYAGLRATLSALQETTNYLGDYLCPESLSEVIGDVDLRPRSNKTDVDKIFELIDLTVGDDDGDADDVIITNEIIFNTIDSDSDVEITGGKEEIIVEHQKTGKRPKKRFRSEDISVIHEIIKKPATRNTKISKTVFVEDLGKPVARDRK